jgi:hypothetical protein
VRLAARRSHHRRGAAAHPRQRALHCALRRQARARLQSLHAERPGGAARRAPHAARCRASCRGPIVGGGSACGGARDAANAGVKLTSSCSSPTDWRSCR